MANQCISQNVTLFLKYNFCRNTLASQNYILSRELCYSSYVHRVPIEISTVFSLLPTLANFIIMPAVCQFPLSLSECPDWPLEAEREPAERGNFSKCSRQTQCHISHTGLFLTCHCAESLPESRRSLRTVGPADGGQSNHSVQRAGPVPPCTQDCCIYWSPRMMT